MKNKYHKVFILQLFLFCIVFQTFNAQAIKIFVSDAETNKQILNAKVCLEGFEIPSINAKYNTKGGYYYFEKIPEKYNTVMVYHKKYNEKGFQDINGLPKELNIKLHDSFLNYYDFNYLVTTETNKENFYRYYVEDPYKIVIKPSQKINYNSFRNYIYNYLKNNDLGIELVNPVWEKYKLLNKISDIKDPYPSFKKTNLNNKDLDVQNISYFPLNGISSEQEYPYTHYSDSVNDITFFLRKKDGKKYKRYNDKIISELRKNKDIEIFSVVIPLGSYNNDEVSKDSFFKKIRNQKSENIKFYKKYNPDFSKVFVYDSFLGNEDNSNSSTSTIDIIIKDPVVIFDLVNVYSIYGQKYVGVDIENNWFSITLLQNLMNKNNDYYNGNTIIKQNINNYSPSIGLGMLDIYEYYYDQNTTK